MAHDRIHQALRGPLAALGPRTGATVVAGTALLDHPRTHWESWPESGRLFHVAWCFGPDGEPFSVLREALPTWPALRGCEVDPARARGGRLLETPHGPVAVRWRDDEEGAVAAPVVWQPRATGAIEHRRGQPSAARLLGPDGPVALVRTCLVGALGGPLRGRSAIARRGRAGVVEVLLAPAPSRGLAWTAAPPRPCGGDESLPRSWPPR